MAAGYGPQPAWLASGGPAQVHPLGVASEPPGNLEKLGGGFSRLLVQTMTSRVPGADTKSAGWCCRARTWGPPIEVVWRERGVCRLMVSGADAGSVD